MPGELLTEYAYDAPDYPCYIDHDCRVEIQNSPLDENVYTGVGESTYQCSDRGVCAHEYEAFTFRFKVPEPGNKQHLLGTN